jgi:hypothetical protein
MILLISPRITDVSHQYWAEIYISVAKFYSKIFTFLFSKYMLIVVSEIV